MRRMKWIERGGRECLLSDYLFISPFPSKSNGKVGYLRGRLR